MVCFHLSQLDRHGLIKMGYEITKYPTNKKTGKVHQCFLPTDKVSLVLKDFGKLIEELQTAIKLAETRK